jgi:hypothetical protein
VKRKASPVAEASSSSESEEEVAKVVSDSVFLHASNDKKKYNETILFIRLFQSIIINIIMISLKKVVKGRAAVDSVVPGAAGKVCFRCFFFLSDDDYFFLSVIFYYYYSQKLFLACL